MTYGKFVADSTARLPSGSTRFSTRQQASRDSARLLALFPISRAAAVI
jgi:hypothetical protein